MGFGQTEQPSLTQQLKTNIQAFTPYSLPDQGEPEAGVLAALSDEPIPRLVFGLRAENMRHHAGQVAFPGGARESQDDTIEATALREAHEEVGLDRCQILGQLSQRRSRYGKRVTPVVGIYSADVKFTADPVETKAVFSVPVDWLLEHSGEYATNHKNDQVGSVYIPAWCWDEYTIWGLTAMIVAELLNVGFGSDINFAHAPTQRVLKVSELTL